MFFTLILVYAQHKTFKQRRNICHEKSIIYSLCFVSKSRNIMIIYFLESLRIISDAYILIFFLYAPNLVKYGLNIHHEDICYTRIPDTLYFAHVCVLNMTFYCLYLWHICTYLNMRWFCLQYLGWFEQYKSCPMLELDMLPTWDLWLSWSESIHYTWINSWTIWPIISLDSWGFCAVFLLVFCLYFFIWWQFKTNR